MKLLLSLLLALASVAHASTYNVAATQTQAQIQSVLTATSAGDTVVFSAGTYNVSATFNVPCNITLTGPVATPATAILNPSFTNQPIFNLTNCTGSTIEYFNFTKTQSIKFNLGPGTWGASGILISHNQFTGLTAQLPTGTGGSAGPACDSGTGSQGNCDSPGDTAVTFTNTSGAACPGCSFLTNTRITYNQFGDAASCTTPADVVDGTGYDYGGNCAGIQFYTALNGVTIEYNKFVHLEEGFHVLCGPVGGNDCSGATAWTLNNFTADYNDFSGVHRFAVEIQLQGGGNSHVDHNSFHSWTSPWAWTFGISNACCAGLNGSVITSPGITNIDNVILAEVPASSGNYIGMADEAWGTGAQYTENLVQGNWQNGFEWAYITGGSISNNTVCGAQMSAAGTLIHNETTPASSEAPTQSGNATGATCSAESSVAPVVTLSGSTFTITDGGANTSIWYTTDGTTPVPGTSHLYSAPFAVSATTTVKAVGMWGSLNQPTSYAAGYGYVPSAVAAATYAGAVVPPPAPVVSLVSAHMASSPTANLNTLVVGQPGIQLSIVGTFSDGSTAAVTSGVQWGTLKTGVISVSSTGMVTGVGVGLDNVTAQIGAVASGQWTMTVTDPPPPPAPVCSSVLTGTTLVITCTGVSQ